MEGRRISQECREITMRLLEHWNDADVREGKRFFFCQIEAIETLIWLLEAPDSEKVGIDISSDGGEFRKLCSKIATGSGKTTSPGSPSLEKKGRSVA